MTTTASKRYSMHCHSTSTDTPNPSTIQATFYLLTCIILTLGAVKEYEKKDEER
jgi:hypothetical protein